MSAGSRIVEGATEALAFARGEQPAARIHVNGQAYVPLAEFEALKAEISRLQIALDGES